MAWVSSALKSFRTSRKMAALFAKRICGIVKFRGLIRCTQNSMPLTGSGAIVIFIMNVLGGFNLKQDVICYHHYNETLKFAFALRSELADPEFVSSANKVVGKLTDPVFAQAIRFKIDNETHERSHYGEIFSSASDSGTAHICIVAPNFDAISCITSINYVFGSMYRNYLQRTTSRFLGSMWN